jgi:hypothetical protein
MKHRSLTAALLVCLAATVSAQENRFEIGASAAGNFMRRTLGNDTYHDAKDRAGVGANFRYWLTGRQGVEISWSYANLFHTYDALGRGGAFKTHTNEATASYVLRLPTWSSRIQPFVMAGGGALVFSPGGNGIGASTIAKPTFTYGGGIDAYLTKKIGLRAQYKGFVLGVPNGGLSDLSTGATTHMAQPSAGVFWRF